MWRGLCPLGSEVLGLGLFQNKFDLIRVGVNNTSVEAEEQRRRDVVTDH